MAYNNGFPVTYPQMFYQPQYQAPYLQGTQTSPANQSQHSTNSGLIWVQGETGAKSYLVAPNTTVPLWDSETQRIFLKSADAAGMPSMKILNYTIEETPNISAPVQKAVNSPVAAQNADKGFIRAEVENALKDPLDALRSDLEAMRGEMDTFRADLYGVAGKKAASKKKEVTSDD